MAQAKLECSSNFAIADSVAPEPVAACLKEKNRIEELLEQQTQLMMRHLQLTEDRNATSMQFMFHTAKDMLKKVDPSVRSIFTEWQKELRVKTNIYVTQMRLWNRYQQAAASETLIRPFAEEAKKAWRWPAAYKEKAQPLANCEASDRKDYDVNDAFAALRQRHAREAQEFILVHQKACVEQISKELGLELQCEALLEQVRSWLLLNKSFFREPAQAEELLTKQARCYAELACREEMASAERRIKDAGPPFLLLVALRVLCVLVAFIAPASMSMERILSVISVLFSLTCGMGLFAEDAFAHSAQVLLGPLPQYLAGKLQLASGRTAVAPKPLPTPSAPVAEELN